MKCESIKPLSLLPGYQLCVNLKRTRFRAGRELHEDTILKLSGQKVSLCNQSGLVCGVPSLN